MKILQSIKKALRKWLQVDTPEIQLSFMVKTKDGKEYQVIGAMGTYLQGVTSNGSKMIAKWETIDFQQFDRLWHHFSEGQEYMWEDGTPYTP